MLKQFAPQLQHEKEMVRRNPNNIKPTKKRLVYLVESLAHRISLEKFRDEVKLHIETILTGFLTTTDNNNVDTDPLHDWARETAGCAREVDFSTSMAHFTIFRTYLASTTLSTPIPGA